MRMLFRRWILFSNPCYALRDIRQFLEKLVGILNNDGILSRLREYQRWLDPTDSCKVLDIYDRLKMEEDQLEDKIDQYTTEIMGTTPTGRNVYMAETR